MSPPFKFFKIRSKSVRKRIILKYSIAALLLVTVFISGYVTVYVNTYNIMYEDKMAVFSVDRTDEGVRVTVLGHVFDL